MEVNRRAFLKITSEAHRGVLYETRFETALTSLEEEGKIKGWRATEQNSEDDKMGIDFL